jgi:hypothetical protein
MIKKTQLKVKELEKTVAGIRPQQSVGTRFTRTGRGFMHRSEAIQTAQEEVTSNIVRWG